MWSMAVQLDSKIVVARTTSPAAGMDDLVVRLLNDGTRDSTLSGDGLVSLAFRARPTSSRAYRSGPDAKIVTVCTVPIGPTRNPIDNCLVVRWLGDCGSSCPMTTLSI
jgi:hypothetical protein